MSLSNRPSGLWAKLFVQTPRLSLPAGVEVLVWVKALPLVGLMSTWELAVSVPGPSLLCVWRTLEGRSRLDSAPSATDLGAAGQRVRVAERLAPERGSCSSQCIFRTPPSL